jgi:glycosyltransferase involved in cell wall biosynthesis
MTTWTLMTCSLFLAAMRVTWRTKRRFDAVYAHNEYAAIAGLLLRLALRIPNVTRLYGTFVADLMKKPLVWLRYPVAAGGFLVPHSLLICANDGTRGDEVARRLRLDLKRFRFWQDGVDRPSPSMVASREDFLKCAPANLRKDSVWVLSCSRLDSWKRIDRIIRAVGVARKAGCDCQLLVAGEGGEKQRLLSLVEELDLHNNIVWLGAVAHDDIWSLMKLADVFVIANDVTNRCNPLFEAVRARLPVVSVRDPSTQDLLTHGDNALLAERDDGDRLGECLAAVCKDSDLAQRMRLAQRNRDALLWTWRQRMEVEVKELAQLVRETHDSTLQGGTQTEP